MSSSTAPPESDRNSPFTFISASGLTRNGIADRSPSAQTRAGAVGSRVDGWDAHGVVDDDLSPMTREQLVVEVVKLRAAIRQHRDSSGHDLCWHHPDLWGTLPEQVGRDIAVPPWPEFLRGCVAYRQSLDRELPDAPTHVAEFEETDR